MPKRDSETPRVDAQGQEGTRMNIRPLPPADQVDMESRQHPQPTSDIERPLEETPRSPRRGRGPKRVAGEDARKSWRQAFSEGNEGRRRTAAASVAKAKHQMEVSIDDARGKRQPMAFFSVIWALIRFVFRCLGALVRLVWEFLVFLAVTFVAIGMVGLIAVSYLYVTTISELPELENFSLVAMPQDSTIYDRDGEVIGVISTSKREAVAFNQIAQSAKDAVVAIEDERFYNHEGVDFFGIARAVFINFQSWASGGGVDQGASTITQQYIRNAYQGVGTEVSLKRKLTEMMLAAQLEAQSSKDDILNSYLNTVYYGNGCYGIEAASQYYFGKSAKDLDYYESAVLAAIVNGPTIYNPATDEGKTNTASRANIILDKMYSLGKLGDITQEQLQELKKTNINDRIHITEKERVINQPYYYDYVMRELRKDYSEEQRVSGVSQIYTTLSIKDGEAATDIVKTVEDDYGEDGVTAAIADVNVADGSVNAFCGGTDYSVSQFNAAIDGRLQNGSTMKPILYATMIEEMGYFVTDLVNCDPIDVAGEGEQEHVITSYLHGGNHSIEEGIIQSDNAMAVRCAMLTGMDRVDAMMKACGAVHDLEDNAIAIIGGQSQGFTPMEMATVYATVANGGVKRDLWCIRSITDNYGNTVYEHKNDESRAMREETALQITHSMEEAVKQRGDWYDIPFARSGGWHIAAKSGTTDDKTDLWTCGFDHQRSVAVWLGGRDAKVEVPTTTPTAAHKLSDYFYAVGEEDSKDEFKQPEYKAFVPSPEEDEKGEDFIARLRNHHFQTKVRYVVDEEKHDGDITSVSNEGEMVSRNMEIKVGIIRNKVTVPDFVKLADPALAYAEANGLDLRFSVKYSTTGTVTPTVTAQSIAAGDLVDHGTTVLLDVNVATPLVSQTEFQVPYRGSDDVMTLLSQDRDGLMAQNKSLTEQVDSLHNDVSKLQEELSEQNETNNHASGRVTIPNLKGLTVKQAKQVLISIGMTVSTSATDFDTVTSSSPSSGATALPGTTVRVYAQKQSDGGTGSSGTSSNTSADTGNDGEPKEDETGNEDETE